MPQSNIPNLLDIVFDTPTNQSISTTINQNATTDSLQTTSANNSSFDDLFGPIVSAPNPILNNNNASSLLQNLTYPIAGIYF